MTIVTGDAVTFNPTALSAALAGLGVTVASGPLRGKLPDPGEATPADLPDEVLRILAAPSRMLRATTLVAGVEHPAITTILAGASGGPAVAVAPGDGEWGLRVLSSEDEATVVLAGHSGLTESAASGGATELSAGGWSMLAVLADHPSNTSLADLENAAARAPGRCADLFTLIGPTRVQPPTDTKAAVYELGAAGLALTRDDEVWLTDDGRAIVEEIAGYRAGTGFIVDHLAGDRRKRVAHVSFIRGSERLFMGVWAVTGNELRVTFGEPGARLAISAVRHLVSTPSVFGD